MAIRNPFLIRILGWLVAQVCRLWLCTLRPHVESFDADLDPRCGARGHIYCFWHEDMLYLTYAFSGQGINVLISRSSDGELISQIVENLGFRAVRGSTSRGGSRAAREIIRTLAGANLGITPDGPRGPRREFQAGAIYLASRTGVPLVPIALAYERPWRLPSWDRMVLPRPFSRVVLCAAGALKVPQDATSESLEKHRLKMANLLSEASERAETLIGRWRTGDALPLISPEAKAMEDRPLRKSA